MASADGERRGRVPSGADAPDVGDFRQGSPLSQWALARYLVGRALAESIGGSLLAGAVILLVGAGVLWWRGWTLWAVLATSLGLGVLAMRALLLAVLRRLTSARAYAPVEERLRALVSDTRGDVLRELRRIGLPGRTWTLPLLALRLLGRRRPVTVERMRGFEISRAVPASRVDELHLLLRSSSGRVAPPGR
jgi:hypothetical protein